MEKRTHKRTLLGKMLLGVGYAVCFVLTMIFIVNVTMIVKSYIHSDKVPDFFGYKPFIVLSGSMEPSIKTGDLIVTRMIAPDKIKVGDIISFQIEKNVVVSHRVTAIINEGGLSFSTKGDANVGIDAGNVSPDSIEGIYVWRAPGLGRFAIFLQTPVGMLIFVVFPLFVFVLYTIFSRNRRGHGRTSREAELEAELAALRTAQKTSTNNNDNDLSV